MSAPEPCLRGVCRSTTACSDWGYCRERNAGTAPTEDQQATRRGLAFGARIHAEGVARRAAKRTKP